MRNAIFLFLAIQFSLTTSFAQKTKKTKLVVGVVVDQMRYDYLYRFENKYGNDGFKRLMNKGFHVENTHYNYVPTYTAVGHAFIYTGTTPQNHGIIGNDWYDKFLKKSIYCVDDSNYTSVGTNTNSGQKSPYRMHTTTVTDQLKLAQNLKNKTISIAIKDRSSILPAGHTGDGVYWFEGGKKSQWISSSYYTKVLPKWVQEYNNGGSIDKYLEKDWNTYYPIETYTESMADDNPYEGTFKGEEKPVFPHKLPVLKAKNGGSNILKSTPFGNSLTTDFALAAIKNENLGQTQGTTDFLTISYSSTDYVGHKYGVDSKEIEDTYIRMDLEIERLLTYLDKTIGKNNYTLFLTADHAVAQTPNYLKTLGIPSGHFESSKLKSLVKQLSIENYGSDNIVENISNYQLFFNQEELKRLKLSLIELQNFFARELLNFNQVYKTITAQTLETSEFHNGIYSLVQQGYNQKLSGDVILIPNPSVLQGHDSFGTTHGSGYSYDTHVPLLFFGNGIQPGSSAKYYPIIDIAPTLCNLLEIEFPNGVTGKVIEEALKN